MCMTYFVNFFLTNNKMKDEHNMYFDYYMTIKPKYVKQNVTK